MFYGILFGDVNTQEFVYKEAGLTRLGEFSHQLHVRGVCGGVCGEVCGGGVHVCGGVWWRSVHVWWRSL